MGWYSIVVQVKGFGSNIYVYVNLFFALVGILCSSVLFVISGWNFNIVLPLLMISFLIAANFISTYIFAPLAYKRFMIDSQGIYFGKTFIEYGNISSVKLARGYIDERFNFKFVEDFLSIKQHRTIYVEDVICINCEFAGFETKKPCVYIPKTKNTDALLRQYCNQYVALFEENKNFETAPIKLKQSDVFYLWQLPWVIVFAFILATGVIANSLFENAYVIWFVSFVIISFLLYILKPVITFFLGQK